METERNGDRSKEGLRRDVLSRMREQKVLAFPFLPARRIPNFRGAREAAIRLLEIPQVADARILKCNPDSAQRPFREEALRCGKILLMPTPRLSAGFWLLNGAKLLESDFREAAGSRGPERFGKPVPLENLPQPDVTIVGSVAVSGKGARCGKGHGFADLESAILKGLGIEPTPVFTTVHDLQVCSDVPLRSNDLHLNGIATPTRWLSCGPEPHWPSLDVSQLTANQLEAMPFVRDFTLKFHVP